MADHIDGRFDAGVEVDAVEVILVEVDEFAQVLHDPLDSPQAVGGAIQDFLQVLEV